MPSTEIVERLHERLIHLGDEPAVAAERGEVIEPPVRPESSIDDDLSALLGDALADAEPEPVSDQTDQATSDPFADVSLGDDDFPVPPDYSFDPDAIPEGAAESGAEAPTEDVDFGDLSGDFGDIDEGTEDLGDFDALAAEDLGDFGALAEEDLEDLDTEPATDLADAALDEPLAAITDASFDDLPETVGEEPPQDVDSGDIDEGTEDLGDFDALAAEDLGDFSALAAEDLEDLATEPATDLADAAQDEPFADISDASFDELPETIGEEPPQDVDFGDLGGDLSDELGGDFGDVDVDAEDLGDFGELAAEDLEDLSAESAADMTDTVVGEEPPQDVDFGDFGGDLSEDLGKIDFDAGDLGEFGELAAEDLEDLGAAPAADIADDVVGEDLPQDVDFGDFGGDLSEDLGEIDFDAEDLGDFETDIADELDSSEPVRQEVAESAAEEAEQIVVDTELTEELGDFGDLSSGEATEEFGVAADGDFAGLSDLDEDIEEETSDQAGFGADFGKQVDEEFGDIDLDEDSLSADPFADATVDSFELPAVEDSIQGIEEEGFSLGDFGDAFDIDEESMDDFAGLDTGIAEVTDEVEVEAAVEAATEELAEKSYTDEEFARIRQTLGTLPLNVRIAVEECIAETKGSPEEILALIDLLITGETPQKIAQHVSRITGTAVQVPKGYQKRSGVAFEEEKSTLRYRIVNVWLPFLRVAATVSAVAVVLGLALFRFVYQPAYAGILYRRGYDFILEDRYDLAEETFLRAYELRPRDRWFVRYAETFVEKREYQRAVEKYDQLVFGVDEDRRRTLRELVAGNTVAGDRLGEVLRYVGPSDEDAQFSESEQQFWDGRRVIDLLNVDRSAILDHGELQSDTLANYQRAEELYAILLFENRFDAAALLAAGDNYYRWADTDPTRITTAGETYMTYMRAHGQTDQFMMRMLRFWIHPAMDGEDAEGFVRGIVNEMQSREDAEIDARIYANAANYLLERELARPPAGLPIDTEDVETAEEPGPDVSISAVLRTAYAANPMQPEVHFVDARNRLRLGDKRAHRASLDEAIRLFEMAAPLDPDQLSMQISADILSGQYYLDRREILTADGELDRALRRYDRAKTVGLLDPDPRLAEVYELRGDILYYESGSEENLSTALDYYQRAVDDGRDSDRLQYKRGFIRYERGEHSTAINHFLDAWGGNGFVGPDNVLYARANTLFRRELYPAAEAHYRELLQRLEVRRDLIRNLLIQENPEHRALIEMLYKTENNIGVTLYRQAQRGGDASAALTTEALDYLRRSAERVENYLRDPDTAIRAEARSLANLNMRRILYPGPEGTQEFIPSIHEAIPRDEEQLFF